MDSRELFERAQGVIPGGVNSPVRAFHAVGGTPVYMERGYGSRVETADRTELVDFCCSWGPLILGHAHPAVVEAVKRAAGDGTSFGANTKREIVFAETLCEMVPYIGQVRIMNSGTEATMTALRLARGVTGRRRILKFEGCYHGHTDYLLVSAGSGLLTEGRASSEGVSPTAAAEVLVAPYNDGEAVNRVVAEYGSELAAIIVEPIAGNMGLVEPADGFLKRMRDAADRTGALLVFDEVITGFRLGPTTYGHLCGVTPDITCLGKIIGGGMPIGGIGGSREVMKELAPLGGVYQAGTLSGNPVAIAAGQATLDVLRKEDPYPELARLAGVLTHGFHDLATAHNAAAHVAQAGSMMTPFFRKDPVRNLADAKTCDTKAFARFFHAELDAGCYLPPSQFEVAFVSAAHTDRDVRLFLDGAEAFFKARHAS